MVSVPDATEQARPLRYNSVAIALHWLTAALIVWQVWLGWTFHELPRGPERAAWFDWHKTVGVLILALALVRLAWRAANPPPPYPSELPRWERLAGTINHWLFYALIIVIPLTGLAAVSARGPTVNLLGGVAIPAIPGISEGLGDAAGGAHEVLILLTLALLVIHILAALKHQFVDRSKAAGRMPPFRARQSRP